MPAKVVDIGVSEELTVCGKIQEIGGKHFEWVPAQYIIAMSAAVPFGEWRIAKKKGFPVALWVEDKIVAVAMPVDEKIVFHPILNVLQKVHAVEKAV